MRRVEGDVFGARCIANGAGACRCTVPTGLGIDRLEFSVAPTLDLGHLLNQMNVVTIARLRLFDRR